MKPIINLLSICAILIVCGCNTTHFTQTKPDGTKIEITNSRMIWTTESYDVTLTEKGAKMSASKSATDTDALKAVAEGAVSGALKAK